MPLLDAGFVQKKTTLEIIARIPNGWEKKAKTYCFSEDMFIDWHWDYRLRIQVTVLPRPGGFGEAWKEFPNTGPCRGGSESMKFDFDGVNLKILVRLFVENMHLNNDLPFISTTNRKLAIYWDDRVEIARLGNLWYELQVLIVFDPPRGKKPGDTKDWFRRFFPGGLPSLGKRR